MFYMPGIAVTNPGDMMAVRGYLRELRELRGMSQDKFGDAVGLSRRAVIDWESGKTKTIKLPVLRRAAQVLNAPEVHVQDLLAKPDESDGERRAQARSDTPTQPAAPHELARRMWAWRDQHSATAEQAAEAAGITAAAWQSVEAGREPATAGTLRALATFFRRPIAEVMTWEGAQPFRPSKDDVERAARLGSIIAADARLLALTELVEGLSGEDVDLLLSIAESLRKRRG